MIKGERADRLFFIPAAGRRSGGGRLQACRAAGSDHQRVGCLSMDALPFLSNRALRLPVVSRQQRNRKFNRDKLGAQRWWSGTGWALFSTWSRHAPAFWAGVKAKLRRFLPSFQA